MAARLVRYRDAHCCRHCSGRTVREISYWGGLKKRLQPWCSALLQAVADTGYCSRFRWAAGFRPPTPARPTTLTTTPQAGDEPPVPDEEVSR